MAVCNSYDSTATAYLSRAQSVNSMAMTNVDPWAAFALTWDQTGHQPDLIWSNYF